MSKDGRVYVLEGVVESTALWTIPASWRRNREECKDRRARNAPRNKPAASSCAQCDLRRPGECCIELGIPHETAGVSPIGCEKIPGSAKSRIKDQRA
ncbi:hypothetical protein KM043_007567 [Ampulex compressa]|nr:hypothetical protein KM043_007567 [Ampulex compressa]